MNQKGVIWGGEVSAKTGERVEEIFAKVVKRVWEIKRERQERDEERGRKGGEREGGGRVPVPEVRMVGVRGVKRARG